MTAMTHSHTHSGKATVTLPSDTQILITREFDAPRELVFRAWTEADLVRQWWGGERGEVTHTEIDLRVGGTWRFVMTANGGFEVAFHGEYREIVPDERLVSTEVWEAMPDHPALTTLILEESDGRTTAQVLVEHGTKEDRDGHIASGMEGGMQESYDRLESVARALG